MLVHYPSRDSFLDSFIKYTDWTPNKSYIKIAQYTRVFYDQRVRPCHVTSLTRQCFTPKSEYF